MLKTRQNTRPKQSTATMPSPHSYTVMQFRSTQNEDDDDICPVCESECTCRNVATPHSTPPQPSPSAPGPRLTQLPLKIKLPARTALIPPSKISTAHLESTNQKQTTAGSVTVGGSRSNYVLLHHPGRPSDVARQLHSPPIPSSAHSLRDTSPLTPEPELEPSSKARTKPKHPAKAAIPKSRKKTANTKSKQKQRQVAPQRRNAAGGISRRKTNDATWTSHSAKRKGKRPVQTSSDEFEDNVIEHREPYVSTMIIDSDDAGSLHFPTFISAISTTSDNDDSASTTSDSFTSDSSTRAEEEKLILEEQRAKVRREILNGEESWHMEKRKWDHLKNNNNWEIRPRKRSVGAEETDDDTETETESEVGVEEDDEDEGDDDEDADVRYGHGMVTGWQSDDDDFDAELFFATLTDSSGPGSDADAEDGDDSGDNERGDNESDDNSNLSVISITEATAAGLLSTFGTGCPLVVTEDWDGRLVFANGLKDGQGVLDVHFEVDAAQRHRSIREAMEVDADETQDNAEEDEEEDAYFTLDDDGETTDDMLDHCPGISTTQGIVPLPFRCPTPPTTSIDPLSTLSPVMGARRSKLVKATLLAGSPNPADILAGTGKALLESSPMLDHSDQSAVASMATTSPPDTATSSSQSRQMPSMGTFEQVSADPKRRAIVDGTKTVASPFTYSRRSVRKRPGRGRKRTASGSTVFPFSAKRPRRLSFPDSTRTWLPVGAEEDPVPLVQSSPELLPLLTSPIGLDDVLDTSFLDSDDPGEPSVTTSGERHLRNLNRWDRVPMGTFRRSRATHIDENGVPVPALAAPNDGVSYGSAGGHVLRKSPLGAALWQTNTARDRTSIHNLNSVVVSPVVFPLRDGERTPTAEEFPGPQKHLPRHAGPSKSRKQQRKEKKRAGAKHISSTPASIPTPDDSYHRPLDVPHLNL